jgi:HPt (histidine-containing phosphotransfer) domain-containing protein
MGAGMVDWSRLRELYNEIGYDDFLEVFTLFLLEAEEVVARLGTELSCPGKSGSEIAEDLHFLRGAALNLGFVDLAAHCADAERLATAGLLVDVNAVTYHFVTVRNCFMQKLDAELRADRGD